MKITLSGIALFNGIILKGGDRTCIAKRTSDRQVSIKIKKHSKRMRKVQLIAFLVLLLLSLIPDTSNTPVSVIYTVVLPVLALVLLVKFLPNLRLLNYHGAEHKVVEAYRQDVPLNLEAVKALSRVTKVCGSMLIAPIMLYVFLLSFLVMFTSNAIIHMVFTVLVFLALAHYFFLRGEKVATVYLHRLLPLKTIKPFRLKSNPLYRTFDRLGYFIQEHFTTKEPSDEELEVAILCLKELID